MSLNTRLVVLEEINSIVISILQIHIQAREDVKKDKKLKEK